MKRLLNLWLGVAAVAGLSLTAAGPGSSASALSLAPAKIVFGNGGRIVEMNSDGSGRKIILGNRKHALVGFGDPGWQSPQVSPDRTRMLVERNYFGFKDDLSTYEVFVANRDGSGVRGILANRGGVRFDNPTWMPDGAIAATRETYRRWKRVTSVVIADPLGKVARKVADLPDQKAGNLKRDLAHNFRSIDLSPSPDGTKMLVTLNLDNQDDVRRLILVDLVTGKRKKIADQAWSGNWSPDGSRIIYSSSRGARGKACDDDDVCRAAGDIFTADPDGSHRQRLTTGRGDEDNASFSPDGSAIVYQSNRNFPRQRTANEVYSMKADRTCAWWLTNGSPASTDPQWVPGSGSSLQHDCRRPFRKALVEAVPKHRSLGPHGTRLWAGPQFTGRLLVSNESIFGIDWFDYGDCAFYRPDHCRPDVAILGLGTCQIAGGWASFLSLNKTYRRKVVRGVATFRRTGKGGAKAVVPAGGSLTVIGGLRSRTRLRDLDDAISELRPVGLARPSARLPRPRIPRVDLRHARKVKRAVKRTGSVRATVRRLGIKRSVVRNNLRFARILPKLGKITPVSCPTADQPVTGRVSQSARQMLKQGFTP